MRTIDKPNRKLEKLASRIEVELINLGATDNRLDQYLMYEWLLDTKAGPLSISLSPCNRLLSVFMRFDDPARANTILGRNECNPYTGKWNSHYGLKECDTPEGIARCMQDLLNKLKRVL